MALKRCKTNREVKTMSLRIGGEHEQSDRHRPKKLQRAFRSSRSYWQEFCNNTSLHGLKYLGEPHRPLAERIWWVLSICTSITACAFLISTIYQKWETSPVIVSFAETSTPVWQIPFPAVTICSEIKVKRTAFNYTKAMLARSDTNITDEVLEELQYASALCNWQQLDNGNLTLDHEKIMKYIAKVSPGLSESFFACIWKGKHVSCRKLFKTVVTDEGLCFTFNSLAKQELLKEEQSQGDNGMGRVAKSMNWTLDAGYTNGGEGVYPLRTHSAGSGAGLTVIYIANSLDMDPWCRLPVLGFKVLLHSPADFPQVGHQFFRAPLNWDIVVGVRPSIMNTSEGLRRYPATLRQCLLSNERQLRFFHVYTQKNCEFECLTNYTMLMCNCTTFFMPRAENATICGAGSNKCVSKVAAHLVDDNASMRKCACMPACTEIKYDVETSQSHFAWQELLDVIQLTARVGKLKTRKLGQISIYFKEMQFTTSRRSELYGVTDFIANCGGLLGLFVGFSFLSLVEFIYFFSVRLYVNLGTRRRAERSTA